MAHVSDYVWATREVCKHLHADGFLKRMILPAAYVKSVSVLSVDDIAILASASASTDE